MQNQSADQGRLGGGLDLSRRQKSIKCRKLHLPETKQNIDLQPLIRPCL